MGKIGILWILGIRIIWVFGIFGEEWIFFS
jgi:hypothetical protein